MKDFIHKEFPKTCERDDFFGQVKRTVHGKPVSEEQLTLIVGAIKSALNFTPKDVFLDIGCGNGALSNYLFDSCSSFLGVDFSDYLIEIAKEYFEHLPDYKFLLKDAAQFTLEEIEPERFSKALCYGVFPYFSPDEAELVLSNLAQRFCNLERFFIGNLPDPEKAQEFYPTGTNYKQLMEDRDSPLGIWRSMDYMKALANRTGWIPEFRHMPSNFYASHYRYDIVLTRRPGC